VQERIRGTLLVVTLAVAGVGCGHVIPDKQQPGETSVTTAAAVTAVTTVTTDFNGPPATTAASTATTTAARTCLSITIAAVKLNRDYSRDVKSFAGADEAAYKARARAVAVEARQLGCPVPASIQSFLR